MPGAPAAQSTRPVRAVAGRLGHVARAYGGVVGSRTYFPLWLGQLASSFGDTLHYIALVILVFQLTGQGVAVAGLVAAEILPVLVLGPIAGVVIDRFGRRSVLIGADLFRAFPRRVAALATGRLARVSRSSGHGCGKHLLQPDRPGG